jgi:hypothetical protein
MPPADLGITIAGRTPKLHFKTSMNMKILLIAVAATLCLFTQSLPANTLKDVVGSWKVRLDGYFDGRKVDKVTGTMRVMKLGKNSFSLVMTLNLAAINGGSYRSSSNLWMFPNGKTAGYASSDGETASVSSGNWRVSGNKIIMDVETYSLGSKPLSASISFTRKSSKRFDISSSDESGYKYKGSITR